MKTVFFATCATLAASAAMADGSPAAECLKRYDTAYVRPHLVTHVAADCRRLLFPPRPGLSAGFYRFSGNQVRAVALRGAERYGRTTRDLSRIAAPYRLFYFPDFGKGTFTVAVPPREGGGLY